MSAPFVTPIEALTVHECGWLRLSNGRFITRLPLLDNRYDDRFARINHSARPLPFDGRLPTLNELVELRNSSFRIAPYTLPTVTMLEAAGVPKPWQEPNGNDVPAMRAYRAAHIRSEEWCILHDSHVWDTLAMKGWVDQPVFNAGKHWGEGGHIYGWDAIQPWSAFHAKDTAYTDYATTTHIVVDTLPDGHSDRSRPIPTMLGARGPAVMTWQSWLNSHGFGPLLMDGIHGPKTEAATIASGERSPIPAPVPPSKEASFLDTIKYVPARLQYPGWPFGPPLGVCIHTSENTEHPAGAEVLQATASRNDAVVSWHYAVDNDSITQSVSLDNRAAAASPGNDRWIHIELFGRTGQGKAGWADAYSTAQMALCVRLVRALRDRFGFPARRLSVDEVIASDVPGIVGHIDISTASALAMQRDIRRRPWWNGTRWRVTNHGDPGADFPWASFLSAVGAP